jgi:hypothetical protein
MVFARRWVHAWAELAAGVRKLTQCSSGTILIGTPESTGAVTPLGSAPLRFGLRSLKGVLKSWWKFR